MATAKQKRRRKFILFAVIVLLIAAGTTYATFFRKREVIITVQTEKVERRNLTEVVVANGKIQPVKQVKISPEVSGEIIELPVKEGQKVERGDLLVRIKPDLYKASRQSAEAGYKSALASKDLSKANLLKAQLELKRNEELYRVHLISDSQYTDFQTAFEVAKATSQASEHQVDVARASMARAEEDLLKTTIYSPISGTISKLNSELGERVVGTAMMSGTEIMTVANLNEMEARVDIGEMDVVLIAVGQKARLEVDAYRDRKFNGVVTEIANSSKFAGQNSSQSQDATRFEVRIRVTEKELFRPGMSVTAEIETRYRTNVLCVPIQSVTTRMPKVEGGKGTNAAPSGTNVAVKAEGTNKTTEGAVTNLAASGNSSTNPASSLTGTNSPGKKQNEPPKPIEVVFQRNGETAKMVTVKRGISDDQHTEITEGLSEGQEIISGGYKAIARDLEDGKKIKVGPPEGDGDKDKAKS